MLDFRKKKKKIVILKIFSAVLTKFTFKYFTKETLSNCKHYEIFYIFIASIQNELFKLQSEVFNKHYLRSVIKNNKIDYTVRGGGPIYGQKWKQKLTFYCFSHKKGLNYERAPKKVQFLMFFVGFLWYFFWIKFNFLFFFLIFITFFNCF